MSNIKYSHELPEREVIDYPGTFYRPAEVIANNLVWYIQNKTELVVYDNESATVVANMDDDLSGVVALYVIGNPDSDKWIDMTGRWNDIVIRWTDLSGSPRSIHVGVAVEPTTIEALLQTVPPKRGLTSKVRCVQWR
jgi:hypothetical protein